MEREITYYPVGHGPITPWGMADSREYYSDEVSFYSTPSHGGFRVSGKSLKRIPTEYRIGYGRKSGWYEEDCDWSIVAIYLPELFDKKEKEHAVRCFNSWIKKGD